MKVITTRAEASVNFSSIGIGECFKSVDPVFAHRIYLKVDRRGFASGNAVDLGAGRWYNNPETFRVIPCNATVVEDGDY